MPPRCTCARSASAASSRSRTRSRSRSSLALPSSSGRTGPASRTSPTRSCGRRARSRRASFGRRSRTTSSSQVVAIGKRPSIARWSSSSTTRTTPGPISISARFRSRGDWCEVPKGSTSSTGLPFGVPISSSFSRTSAWVPPCTRSWARARWSRCSLRGPRIGVRSSRRRPGSGSSSGVATAPS